MKTVQLSDETHARLKAYADGRPLGKAVARLLDEVGIDSIGPVGSVDVKADTGSPAFSKKALLIPDYPFPEDKRVKK